jgi:hypothetical protein
MQIHDGEEKKIGLPICINVRKSGTNNLLQAMGSYCDYFPLRITKSLGELVGVLN